MSLINKICLWFLFMIVISILPIVFFVSDVGKVQNSIGTSSF